MDDGIPTDLMRATLNAQAFAAREAIAGGLWDRHLVILEAAIRARMRSPEWQHPTAADLGLVP